MFLCRILKQNTRIFLILRFTLIYHHGKSYNKYHDKRLINAMHQSLHLTSVCSHREKMLVRCQSLNLISAYSHREKMLVRCRYLFLYEKVSVTFLTFLVFFSHIRSSLSINVSRTAFWQLSSFHKWSISFSSKIPHVFKRCHKSYKSPLWKGNREFNREPIYFIFL